MLNQKNSPVQQKGPGKVLSWVHFQFHCQASSGEDFSEFQSCHLTRDSLRAAQSSSIPHISAESKWLQLHFLGAQNRLLTHPLAEGSPAQVVFAVNCQGVL